MLHTAVVVFIFAFLSQNCPANFVVCLLNPHVPCIGVFSYNTMATDRDILLVLYRLTDGPNWIKNTNWDTDAVLSEWDGVEVNDQDRVVKLSLGNCNLRGIVTTQQAVQ